MRWLYRRNETLIDNFDFKRHWYINSKDVRISEIKKTASEAVTNSYPVKKANYRVTNWAEYNQALINRGDVI
jgi:hypothetical protein